VRVKSPSHSRRHPRRLREGDDAEEGDEAMPDDENAEPEEP
jgi:hypothetical protein